MTMQESAFSNVRTISAKQIVNFHKNKLFLKINGFWWLVNAVFL